MATEFSVKLNELERCAAELERQKADLRADKARVESIYNQLCFAKGEYANVRTVLKNEIEHIKLEVRSIDKMQQVLRDIATTYKQTEGRVVGANIGAGASGGNGKSGNSDSDSAEINKMVNEWIDSLGLPAPIGGAIKHYINDLIDKASKSSLVQAIKNFPSKEDHYNRNQNMPFDSLPQTPEEAAELGWDDGVAANCHQFTAKNGKNIKYVSPDGKYEVIFDSEGNMVTAPEDVGTYNIASPNDDGLGHAIDDVIPWIIWGNSPDDTTNMFERITKMIGL